VISGVTVLEPSMTMVPASSSLPPVSGAAVVAVPPPPHAASNSVAINIDIRILKFGLLVIISFRGRVDPTARGSK
jgi:hypothetical protein